MLVECRGRIVQGIDDHQLDGDGNVRGAPEGIQQEAPAHALATMALADGQAPEEDGQHVRVVARRLSNLRREGRGVNRGRAARRSG